MNTVECHVTNCQHYQESLCSLNQIKIDGPAAKDKGQTCCMSFDEKQSGATNSVGEQPAAPETGIHCKAENCRFNSSSKCSANGVHVSCESANATAKSATQCTTFQER